MGRAVAMPDPSLERDLHQPGTWPAKRSLSSSASLAKCPRRRPFGPNVKVQMKTLRVISLLMLSTLMSCAFAFDLEKDRQDREQQARSLSHCANGERVVFSCRMKGKVVSVCASAQLEARVGYVQYRYGALGKVELALPAKETFKPSDVGYFSFPGAGSREYYMKFANGNTWYFIRYSSVRGDDDPKTDASNRHESAWLVVTNGRKKSFSRSCSSPEFDDNVGEHFWGGAVTTLEGEKAFEPYDD